MQIQTMENFLIRVYQIFLKRKIIMKSGLQKELNPSAYDV